MSRLRRRIGPTSTIHASVDTEFRMADRFYVESSLETETVDLGGPEAHHLLNVLRLRPPAEVVLFDGRGTEATAVVESTAKKSATLRIMERRGDGGEPDSRIVLATAVPKGDRFRWLVEKATELGVDRLVPLQTVRSVVDPRHGKLEKLRQTVVSACKQSGRNRLMELVPPATWDEFLRARVSATPLLVAHPGGEPPPQTWPGSADRGIELAVGPEGGFTPDELDAARAAGARPIDLGPQILRIETAAIALAAWVRFVGPRKPGAADIQAE